VELLAKLVAEKGEDWDSDAVHAGLLVALRSSDKDPQGMSPFKATFGYEMPLPSAFFSPISEIKSVEVKELAKIHAEIKRRRDEAAEKYKARFDEGRFEREIKVGDFVWLRHLKDHKLDDRRKGPLRVKNVLRPREGEPPLDVELEELPQGPKLHGNKSVIVNIKDVEIYDVRNPPEEVEEEVAEILKHRKRRGKVWYCVRWSAGEETWEPMRNLVDVSMSEGVTINAALKRYWQKVPQVKPTRIAGWQVL